MDIWAQALRNRSRTPKAGSKMFSLAMATTIKTAKETDQLCYLYRVDNQYVIANHYVEDWLFKAWPGGRKVLSMAGKQLAQELGILE